MMSTRGGGLVVTVGNGDSPHLRAWVAEAEDLGWRRLHVESHGAGVRGVVTTLRQALAARVALARAGQRPAVVEAHGAGRAALVAATLVAPHPTVIVHGSEVLRAPRASSAKTRALAWVLGRSSEVIVTSPSSVDPVVRLAPQVRTRTRVVHPGVAWEHLSAAHVDRDGPLMILSVRRMLPLYHIRELVRAHLVQPERDSLVLLRGDVRDGEAYADMVTTEAARSPREVRVIDEFLSSSELIALYESADIAVSVAESDQLSASVLEALAAGCVLVLSDLDAYSAVGGLPQVVLVPVGAGAPELADVLQRAKRLVDEQGRTAADRAHRAAAARQAFDEAYGTSSTILPTD